MSSLFSWFQNSNTTQEPSTILPASIEQEQEQCTNDSSTERTERSLTPPPCPVNESSTSFLHSYNREPNPIVDPTQEVIKQTLHSWAHSWNEGRLDDYLTSYADDQNLRYISSSLMATKRYNDILVIGKDVIRDVFTDVFERAKRYQEKIRASSQNKDEIQKTSVAGSLHYSDIHVDLIRDDYAFVFGRYRYELGDLDDIGVFTLQMVLHEGQWRILTEHASAMPQKK